MILFRRFSVFIIILFASINQVLGYDSLKLALTLHQSSQYPKALPLFIKLAYGFKTKNDFSNYSLCQLKIADIVRNYGGINLAIEMLNANEKFLEVRSERPTLELAQNFIAKAEALYSANRLADFKESILKSIKAKKDIDLPENYLAEDYLHLGRYYKEFRNQSDSCLYWIKQSLRLAKKDKSLSAYILPRIYNLYGYYYHPPSIVNYAGRVDLFYDHLSLSREYYDSALLAIDAQRVKDKLMLGKVYHNLGNSFNNEFSENGNSETINMALGYYRKSLEQYELLGSPSELVIKDWVVGRAYERLNQTDSAILQFHTGIQRLLPDFNPVNVSELPTLQPTLNDSWFISLLTAKANSFYYKFIFFHNHQDLLTAYYHYTYLLRFHRYLLSQSLNENESISWNYLFGSNCYQLLLITAFELVKKTGDMDYLEKVYPLIASSKYAWINKQDIDPALSTTINKSILKEEAKLVKRQLLKTVPSLTDEDVDSILPTIPDQPVSALFQINLAKQVLDTASVSMIQQRLGEENSFLLDFYVSGLDLYTVIISKNTMKVEKQELNSEFKKDVYKLKKSLPVISVEEYTRLSNNIYKGTLDSPLINLPSGVKRLVICPDENLINIPWDGLVTDTLNVRSFRELNYVLNRYSIRTVLTPSHLVRPSKVTEGFYGIAANFNSSKRFSSIPFSNSLVKLKADQFHGIISNTLLKDSVRVNIFHVASHVVSDSLKPYFSMMYFSDSDSVSLSDFSKSKIWPKLAILNGCQTGSGTYYQSEGTISFARAFYRMGSESVLMTLWNVDDKATADILERFYVEMERGNSLDISLQKAKVDFIQNGASDELANPYYWAGLQLSGKANSIYKSYFTLKMSIAIVIFASALLVLYFIKSRNIRSPVKVS